MALWVEIIDTNSKLISNNYLPSNVIHKEVGDGRNVSFWHDIWCGSTSLASRYNRLYHLDINKFDMAANKWIDGNWHIFISQREDKWKCSLSSNGLFSVKTIREHLDRVMLPSLNVVTTWIKQIPRKVNVFWWRLRLDSLPLRWNLSTRGVELTNLECPVCNSGIERQNHLFFECEVANDSWRLIRVWMDIGMPRFASLVDLQAWLDGLQTNSDSIVRIKAIMITVLWVLWSFRNGVVFNDVVIRRSSIFDIVKMYSFRWLKNRGNIVSVKVQH
ncbi:uncharacterized protein [Rutidosis leptorrhynchoides]|uniref:uncharacterized protein n=1 Tax=Rutidosis leptorrhynchoides TaxID=125765 RepID=UPI003A990E80